MPGRDLHPPVSVTAMAHGFDHMYPVRSSRLVVCSDLSNLMRTELRPEEFRLAVAELAAHHAGAPTAPMRC